MDNDELRGLLYQLENNIERAESDSWTVLCLDVRQGTNLRDMLRSAIADSDELASLRARIAGAAVGTVVYCDLEHYERPAWHVVDDRYSVTLNEPKRVRLLPVGEVE